MAAARDGLGRWLENHRSLSAPFRSAMSLAASWWPWKSSSGWRRRTASAYWIRWRAGRGSVPEYIRNNNGPEFVAPDVQELIERHGFKRWKPSTVPKSSPAPGTRTTPPKTSPSCVAGRSTSSRPTPAQTIPQSKNQSRRLGPPLPSPTPQPPAKFRCANPAQPPRVR